MYIGYDSKREILPKGKDRFENVFHILVDTNKYVPVKEHIFYLLIPFWQVVPANPSWQTQANDVPELLKHVPPLRQGSWVQGSEAGM